MWTRRGEYTAKASDTVRNSAIAGLAGVWLFSGTSAHGLSALSAAPWGLLVAGALFACSLAADILHYFVAAEVFYSLATAKEEELGGYDPDAEAPVTKRDLVWPTRLYTGKVFALFSGYLFMVAVLMRYAIR